MSKNQSALFEIVSAIADILEIAAKLQTGRQFIYPDKIEQILDQWRMLDSSLLPSEKTGATADVASILIGAGYPDARAVCRTAYRTNLTERLRNCFASEQSDKERGATGSPSARGMLVRELAGHLNMSNPTLNKFANIAKVPMAARGCREHKWTHDQVRRILDVIIKESTTQKHVRAAIGIRGNRN